MIAVRRLAAILVADVDGYSRLIGEDVAETPKAVRERLEAARPIVSNIGGRIVKTTGDGVMLEFPSRCRSGRMRHRYPTLIVERQHRRSRRQTHSLLHGVNLSAVLIHGEDVLGDGVNIAARLEDVSIGIGVIGIGRSSASYSARRAGNCCPHRLRKTKTSKRIGKSCYSRHSWQLGQPMKRRMLRALVGRPLSP